MPPRETYDPDGMSVEKRREFDAWCQAQVDAQREFHLRQEVVAYCSVDVTILRQGVLTFCREFRGTWVSEEVELALRKRYRIRRVWETYHYPQRSRQLFRSYVLKFQQAKEHASGWPPHVTTPEQRAAYVQDYEAHEGVRLDPDRMHFNPGVRAIAKHELNSLWGKFGESPNKMTTEYITVVPTWLRLATSPRHDVHAVYPVNQDMIMVMYNLHEEYTDSLTNDMCTSVSIAAWTTWLARKKLYVEVLDVLKERVCYMDTDSCMFETARGTIGRPVGTYFGDLTDEISGE